MKRINNLSVYTVAFWLRILSPICAAVSFRKSRLNLLGYLFLAVAAYTFVNTKNTDVIVTSPVTGETNQSAPNRHTINLISNQTSHPQIGSV